MSASAAAVRFCRIFWYGPEVVAMSETTYCGTCGAPIWNDWRGALHTCKPRKVAS